MDRITTFVFLFLLAGCTRGDNGRQIPSWGYLPEMSARNLDTKRCDDKEYPDIPPGVADIGDPLHAVEKPTTGVSHQMSLGMSCVIASISTAVYKAPEDQLNNYYTISVQAPQADSRCATMNKPIFCKLNPKSYLVLFSRNLPSVNVGQSFRNKRMEDVVSFDATTNLVSFKVGKDAYEYRLPNL